MPLILAAAGEPMAIRRIGGQVATRSFLEKLGFIAGATVTLIAAISGNVIVQIRGSRVAISREMASKILVSSP